MNWLPLTRQRHQLRVLSCHDRAARSDGIDVCGQRLADEIRGVVRRHPSLTRITVIGHSMGGLLVRFAIGGEWLGSVQQGPGRSAHLSLWFMHDISIECADDTCEGH